MFTKNIFHQLNHFISQEDPRLKFPVHMRTKASLNPNDLGPLPVSIGVGCRFLLELYITWNTQRSFCSVSCQQNQVLFYCKSICLTCSKGFSVGFVCICHPWHLQSWRKEWLITGLPLSTQVLLLQVQVYLFFSSSLPPNSASLYSPFPCSSLLPF